MVPGDIRPLKPPLDPPADPLAIAVVAALIVIALVLLGVAVWLAKRWADARSRSRSIGRGQTPRRDAGAPRRLASGRDLTSMAADDARVVQLYQAIADVVRARLEHAFAIPAFTLSTSELAVLGNGSEGGNSPETFPGAISPAVISLLRTADEVRYGFRRPSRPEREAHVATLLK